MKPRNRYFAAILLATTAFLRCQTTSPSFDLKGERLDVSIQDWARQNPQLWSMRRNACDVHSDMDVTFHNFATCTFTGNDLSSDKRTFDGKEIHDYIVYFDEGRLMGISYMFSQPQDEQLKSKLIEKFGPPKTCESTNPVCFWVSGDTSLWVELSSKPNESEVSLLKTAYISIIAGSDLR